MPEPPPFERWTILYLRTPKAIRVIILFSSHGAAVHACAVGFHGDKNDEIVVTLQRIPLQMTMSEVSAEPQSIRWFWL